MKKAQAAQITTSADMTHTQPMKATSLSSMLLSSAFILVGSVVTSTLAMVLAASVEEVSRQMETSSIDTFLDLVATIFFTLLNVIAAGAESVQAGLVVGIYVGVALSLLYLVTKWIKVNKGWQMAAPRKG